MLRVSVVRDILKARISARALVRSKPRAMAPPTVVAFRKLRRENSTKHLLTELQNRRYATQRLGCQVISRTRRGNGCSMTPPCFKCESTMIFQAMPSAGGDFGN